MQVLGEITQKHAELDADITAIRQTLEEAESFDGETITMLEPRTGRVKAQLEQLLETKESELFPHAERVFGDTLEEVSDMSEGRDELLEDFEAFAELVELRIDDVDELKRRFESFAEKFERHVDAQRAFFSLYSTILYPSGAQSE